MSDEKMILERTPRGRCDFCQIREAKHTINGGLWWICTRCMKKHYAYDAKLKTRFPLEGEEE